MYRLQTHVHAEIERLANLDGGAEALAKKLLEAQQQAEDAEFAVGQQVGPPAAHMARVLSVKLLKA